MPSRHTPATPILRSAHRGPWIIAYPLAVVAMIVCAVPYAGAQSLDPETMERAMHAAVMVRTSSSKSSEGDTLYGTGSGFFVNATGMCVSNNHVVDPGHHKTEQEKFALKNSLNRLVWTVVTDSGTSDEKEWPADVLYQNEQADLAVLQLKDEDGDNGFLETPNYLRFRPTAEVAPGLKAWCLGFPGGDARKSDQAFPPVAVTSGNIVSIPRSSSGRITMIETDVLANQGNSGGPFIDRSGRLVGVLTLGSQTEARTNTTMLVPGDLVQKMILTTFRRGKVPAGVDLTPLYDLFPNESRVWDLPETERLEDRDCVTLETDSRICGKVTAETLSWPTPLGNIDVPRAAMAYIRTDEDSAMAFLDGGDRFSFDRDSTIQFTPDGGESKPLDLADVKVVAFRIPKNPPEIPAGEAYVIGGADFHLSLVNVSGDVKVEDDTVGKLSVPATDIVRIATEETDRIIYTTSGSRMEGRVKRHTLKATLAWSGSPIEFNFKEVEAIEIRRVDYRELAMAGEIDLSQSLETGDPRLIRIAKALDTGMVKDAGPLLDELLEKSTLRALSSEKKEQVRFLKGEFLLRSGKPAEAAETFKKLKRAKVENVQWHARARSAILERFKDGVFDNTAMTDPDVFRRASQKLAQELTQEASHGIDGMDKSHPDTRGAYSKLLKRGVSAEEQLQIANRLTGGDSEEYLVQLWRITRRLHRQEITRLNEQRQTLQGQRTGPGPGGRDLSDYQRQRIDQKITQIERNIETAEEDVNVVGGKIQNAGFLIDDPDVIAGRTE